MGRNCKTAVGELPIKDIYVYPLDRKFRELLVSKEEENEYR
jgi:hypothetical protein